MFSNWLLVILSAFSLFCECYSSEHIPEYCNELYSTFLEELQSLGLNVEEFFDTLLPESNWNPKTQVTEDFFFNTTHLISKRGESSEHYTFKFSIVDREDWYDDLWNLTIQFDSNANISSIVPSGTLAELLPMDYRVTKYTFPPNKDFYFPEDTSEEEGFYAIEGTRCKFSFNNDTGPDGKAVCWNTPRICGGNFQKCMENDDQDNFCYDDILQEGTRPYNEDTEVYWTEIAQDIYWSDPATYFIRKNQKMEFREPVLKKWECHEYGGKGVTFSCTLDLSNYGEPNLKISKLVRKTLSGFKG